MNPTTPEEAQRLIAEAMSEAALFEHIRDAAKKLGWRYYHTYDSRRSSPSFPDLVLVRCGRLIVAELKRETGQPTGPQLGWLGAIRVCGVEVYLWRPSDWLAGRIAETLR